MRFSVNGAGAVPDPYFGRLARKYTHTPFPKRRTKGTSVTTTVRINVSLRQRLIIGLRHSFSLLCWRKGTGFDWISWSCGEYKTNSHHRLHRQQQRPVVADLLLAQLGLFL